MIIFVPNLPEELGLAGLRQLAERALRGIWLLPLTNRGRIEACEILHIREAGGKGEEFHGLVHLSEDSMGRPFIRQLGRETLDGRPIRAREYVERSPLRDPRVGLPAPSPLAIVDRRKGDRRRPNLHIEILGRC